MSYIGNQVGNRFVASQAATRFSGNGSNKVFTLDHSVGSDEDILVSVDGVIQEPSISYVVSNGTTLTFQGTDAPSNGTNNIFVCYLFRTVATVGHPSTSALSATSGTFSGAITGGGTFTPGGNIVIPDAGNIGSASDTDAISISSGGVVNFTQSPTGGPLVKLVDQAISTSDGTFVINNSFINSTYDSYLFLYEIHTLTSDEVQMQVKFYLTTTASGDAGSIISGNHHSYGNTQLGMNSSTSAYRSQNYNSSYGVIGTDEMGNSTGEGGAFHGVLQNVNTTDAPVAFNGQGSFSDEDANHKAFAFHVGMDPGTYSAYYCRGILFQFSGGQHTGKFKLYGFN